MNQYPSCTKLLFSLTVLLLGVVGCGEAESEPELAMTFDQSSEAIKDGYSDPDTTHVIGIASNGGQGFGICTGTLISPNVVLTAQHCVSPTLNDTQGVDCSQTRPGTLFAADSVFITFETRMPFSAEGYYAVKEITVPDGDEFCGRDIAIMILQDPVDPSLATPALPRVDLDIVKGEIYSAVGYGGDDSGSWDASGRRRRRDDLFVECPFDQCSLRYQFAMRDTEFLGDTGVCQGDSGGPALDAEGRVIGVVSRGGAGCSSPIYGAVYGWSQWIKDTTASAAISAGLDVPLWTRGFSTSPEFNYPVGNACTDGSQCPSGICQAGVCTRVCSESGPCPDGYDCHPQRLVCLPNSLDTTNPSPSGSGNTEEKSDDGGCASANGTPLALLGLWWARRRKRRDSIEN